MHRFALTLTIILALFLNGCATGFTVIRSHVNDDEGDRFLFIAENNRLSAKDIEGGRFIGGKGIYFNPFVERNSASGQITALGFNVINQSMTLTSTHPEYESEGLLGDIQAVRFRLSDGSQAILVFGLQVTSVQKFNSSGLYSGFRPAIGSTLDSDMPARISLALIRPDDFYRMSQSSEISCDIKGSRGTITFLPDEIESDFLPNLKHFYETYVR